VVTARRTVRDATRWEGLLGCDDSRKVGDILGSVAPRRRGNSSGSSSSLDNGDDRGWNCIVDDGFIGCLKRRSTNGVNGGDGVPGKSKHSDSGHNEKIEQA
jgi:hypothetical protein